MGYYLEKILPSIWLHSKSLYSAHVPWASYTGSFLCGLLWRALSPSSWRNVRKCLGEMLWSCPEPLMNGCWRILRILWVFLGGITVNKCTKPFLIGSQWTWFPHVCKSNPFINTYQTGCLPFFVLLPVLFQCFLRPSYKKHDILILIL